MKLEAKPLAKRVAAVLLVIIVAITGYYLYQLMRAQTTIEKIAAIIHDEDRRELTPRLKNFLRDDSLDVRKYAALAIGRIGNRQAGPLLFDRVADSSIDVAATATFALGLTEDHTFALKLAERAPSLPARVAAQALLSAGRLVDTSSMSDVLGRIAHELQNAAPEVREAACLALLGAKAKTKALDLISLLNAEQDTLVQKAALYALARLGIVEAASQYERFLPDADPFVRSTAVLGLGKCPTSGAERYVAIALNDVNLGVEAQAIASLVARPTPEAINYLVRKLANVTDENLRVTLVDAFQKLKNPQIAPHVDDLMAHDSSVNITVSGIKYLAAVQSDRALSMIDSILARKPPLEIRAACAEGYGLIDKPTLASRLTILFKDEAAPVRIAAYGALIQIDKTNLDFYLTEVLADKDFEVNDTAVGTIRQARLTKYLPNLAAVMSRGNSVDPDLRRTIVEAMESFAKDSTRNKQALEILTTGLQDREYVVRRAAASVNQNVLCEDKWDAVPPAATHITESEIVKTLTRYQQTNPVVTIVTSKGEMRCELYPKVAPLAVINFMKLTKAGRYNGLTFHRVVPDFVIQGGDPRGDGSGGPGYYIRCEYSGESYVRGAIGIATSGKDTGGSQFFITLSPQPRLNARYTLFGRVTSGMDVADRIVKGDKIVKIAVQDGKR